MRYVVILNLSLVVVLGSCAPETPEWETANPVLPVPEPPLGVDHSWEEIENPPTPVSVRLGRWLFYDTRLSADNTISCATCHRPENAFSEPTPVSTGIGGQRGGRKAPTFINAAWALLPHTFWDGRASSLEEQALGPIANPIEMGSTHEELLTTIKNIKGYAKYFEEVFGSSEITTERIGKVIADYERTRMSGNSPYDRWKNGDEAAVSEAVKLGDQLFFDKGGCNQCHLGYNFTDSLFHNLGIGWNDTEEMFSDNGRFEITGIEHETGAFKTPTVREVTKRSPYMHDGSILTLREVVTFYNRGGNANPNLDPKMQPLSLTDEEIDALVAMMEAMSGEGYADVGPSLFPQ